MASAIYWHTVCMGEKPKLGVVFVTSGWFRDVGLQTAESDTTAYVERTAQRIIHRLKAFAEPVYPGVLFTVDDANKAGRMMRDADVDGILLSPLMWCEDRIVRSALSVVSNLPILLWTFSPNRSLPEFVAFQTMIQGSGAVCTLQLSGMLKREEYHYLSVAGCAHEQSVYKEIAQFSRAASIARKLKQTRVGVLPFPCEHMSTTFVDEFQLRNMYGVELHYLELQHLKDLSQDTTAQEIGEFRHILEAENTVVTVNERNLTEGIKYALAIEKLTNEIQIDILAMNDVVDEMHQCYGLRPCLTNPSVSRSGPVVSMEADIAAGIAMYVLRLYTGQSPFYTETFSIDYDCNALLLGHAGYHDSDNHDPALPVEIIPDVEYENSDRFTGAVTYFKFLPGPVTVINSVWDGARLRWVAVEGESLPGPFKLEGNSHLFCKLSIQVRYFLRTVVECGVSQHWIVVRGHILESLKSLCKITNIGFRGIVCVENSRDGHSSRP